MDWRGNFIEYGLINWYRHEIMRHYPHCKCWTLLEATRNFGFKDTKVCPIMVWLFFGSFQRTKMSLYKESKWLFPYPVCSLKQDWRAMNRWTWSVSFLVATWIKWLPWISQNGKSINHKFSFPVRPVYIRFNVTATWKLSECLWDMEVFTSFNPFIDHNKEMRLFFGDQTCAYQSESLLWLWIFGDVPLKA